MTDLISPFTVPWREFCATPNPDGDMDSDSTDVIQCQKKILAQAVRHSNETAGLAWYINKNIT